MSKNESKILQNSSKAQKALRSIQEIMNTNANQIRKRPTAFKSVTAVDSFKTLYDIKKDICTLKSLGISEDCIVEILDPTNNMFVV